MLKIQNADLQKLENQKEKENTLSKSADTLSTRDLILNLNDSYIARKSKEYNFDFSNPSSYDTTTSNCAFLGVKEDNIFSSNFNLKSDQDLKLTGRKTSYHLTSNTEKKLENLKNLNNSKPASESLVCQISHLDENENNYFDIINNNNFQNENNSNCNNPNKHQENNKDASSLSFSSSQNISKVHRNNINNEAFKKLKEKMLFVQQQKKNYEFVEVEKQLDENENDNPNVYFEE